MILPERPYHPASDATLVVLARQGDDVAFDELVRRHERRLRDLLTRLSGNAAVADELAQDAFVRAWKKLADIRNPGALGGWLRQIAVTTWLQHARRAEVSLVDADQEPESPVMPQPALKLEIEEALARLRPPERLCVTLAYAEGMSHAEIAKATGFPLGTAKTHVARGATKLRGGLGVIGRETLMSNDSDTALRHLFSDTNGGDADEAFVAQVTDRIARRRRVRKAGQLIGRLVLLAVVISQSQVLVNASTYVSLAPGVLMGYLGALFVSPLGWLTSVLTP